MKTLNSSEVLLGTFISSFIHDALLPTPEDDRFQLLVFPQKDGGLVYIAV
jgi:hypothetical protein